MDRVTQKLIERIDAACRQMEARLDSENTAAIQEIKDLADKLRIEQKANRELRRQFDEAVTETDEVSRLRQARARDLEELTQALDELKPLLGGAADA
ncbi:MAG: hypothetical protein OXF74_14965 [Rhodobacteraceae bacterium]|nr:hypothetical protein [Paracoccaceae bacterium]